MELLKAGCLSGAVAVMLALGVFDGVAFAKSCRKVERYNGFIVYTKIRVSAVSCRKARRLIPRATSHSGGVLVWDYAGWTWTLSGVDHGHSILRGRRGGARIRATIYSA
jgi:hypothetical protein